MRALIFIGSLSILAAMPAHAGVQTPPSFSCSTMMIFNITTHTLQPIGYQCSGVLAGARNSTTTTDFATFTYTLGSTAGFSASYNGQQYACAPSSSGLQSEWPVAIGARGYFYVSMDLNGNCTSVQLANSSQYVNY
jgi:hypothetical protein